MRTAPDRRQLAFVPRATPLHPCAVVGRGGAARRLGRRLVDAAALDQLTAVASAHLLVVLGPAAELPWVDHVTYLGRDPAAPELLLPTTLAPTVPVAVLAHALRRWAARASGGGAAAPPLALIPEPLAVVPCGAARPIELDRLATWLASGGPP